MRRLLILVAALALLTTACKIEVNAEFTINADKSGSVTLEIGLDDELLAMAEASGQSADDMLADFDIGDVPGAEVSTERRGDMTFNIIKVPIDDITAAENLGGEMAAGLTESFEVTFTDDLVTVRGTVPLDDALGDMGGGDLEGISPDMMAQFFAINIRITMPGKILEHNATSQSGNTLTWAVDLTSGTLEISAESNPNASAGSSSVLLYVIIGAAVILAALLLWLFLRKRGGAAPEASFGVTPTGTPAGDYPPPAPPPSE
ncbi:MAG: hypothetical protein KJ698_10460 [Actinobacteria bacterium]|nr:hypothetical protein [Actinomycetota bacterium]MBU1493941.1 hypothetical protein [Actinomycetota bacterium]MBU1865822.1 hypothetical protein [Actinomycetota bacterium]